MIQKVSPSLLDEILQADAPARAAKALFLSVHSDTLRKSVQGVKFTGVGLHVRGDERLNTRQQTSASVRRGRREDQRFIAIKALGLRFRLQDFPGGAQCAVQLAQVFGQFGGPGHARTGLVGVFEAENFGV